MKDTIISFETALLAKKKGFIDSISCIGGKNYYNEKGELNGDSSNELKEYLRWKKEGGEFKKMNISAPTQSILQKWLRERIPRVIVFVIPSTNFKWTNNLSNVIDNQAQKFDTYEEALEEGLRTALNLI